MTRKALSERHRFTGDSCLLVLNLCLAFSSIGLWVIALSQGLDWRADFSAYYTGWTMVLRGDGRQLYDLATQTRYQQTILNGRSFSQGLLPYNNPPHLTLPLVPLALLPLPSAYRVWAIVQLGLLVWLFQLLQRLAHSWTARERLLMFTAVCGFLPLARTFLLGTFSLWMLICIMQLYLALKQHQDTRAGIWLTLATIKFQIVLLPAIMLLAGRRWRALGSAMILGGVLGAATTLLLGWHVWSDYIALLQQANTYFGAFGIVPSAMYNLRGTLTILLGDAQGALINQISTAILLGAALACGWLWRGPWRSDVPRFALRMALTLLFSVLCNPHVNSHDGLILVVPAALFYDYLRRQRVQTRTFGAFALLCPLVFWIGEFGIGARLGIRLPVVVMLIFAGWLLLALCRVPAPQDAPSA